MSTLDKVVQAVNDLGNETLRAELLKAIEGVRARMRLRQIVCDRCKLVIPPGNPMFDIEMSYQVVPENVDDVKFDPQYRVYLCSECAMKLEGALPGVEAYIFVDWRKM